jgi:16S rRNA (guanine(966)-N(2))-methyltransferase RsmD
VRESLFNILARRVERASFLDAFAGTGAIGIEAISRGARSCVFVESEKSAVAALRENLHALGIEDRARVVARPFLRAAADLVKSEDLFDLVYLDPPYGPGELLRAVRLCSADSILSRHGLIVAEHDARLRMPEEEGSVAQIRTVRYGRAVLTLYERVDRAPAPP